MADVFFRGYDQALTPMFPGASRKMLARGGSLMVMRVNFAPGAAAPLHSHPHEQVSYIVSGRFEFTVGEETREVGEGDSVYIASGVSHGVKALAHAVIVDVFTPQREDLLPGKSE
jgi:quercetin dioxygenase-like cupin family protein